MLGFAVLAAAGVLGVLLGTIDPDEALKKEYADFRKLHNKEYQEEEQVERFKRWKATNEFIEEVNSRAEGNPDAIRIAHNWTSDLNDEEYASHFLSVKAPSAGECDNLDDPTIDADAISVDHQAFI